MDSIIWAGIATGCVVALAGIGIWAGVRAVRADRLLTELKAYKRSMPYRQSMRELVWLNEYLINSEKRTPCAVCGVVIPTMWASAINPHRHLTCRV